jgi:hypothetical protein
MEFHPTGGRTAVRLQPDRKKTGPRSGRSPVRAEGPRGCLSYVHTPKATSHCQVFEGTTQDYIDDARMHKRNKYIIELYFALCGCERQKQAQALLSCGKWFTRLDFPCGTYRLLPKHCNFLLCPECCHRRSIPLQRRVVTKLKQSEHDYWHLTITVKNWKMLTNGGLKGLIKMFSKLRHTETWTDYVTGGLWSLEAIWSESDSWHPHFHVLIETPKRLPMGWIHTLKDEWREITGDSHVLYLEKMYGLDKKRHRTRKVNLKSVKEIVKYTTKAADFSGRPDLVEEFVSAFENIRRVQAFGSFLGLAREEENAAEQDRPEGSDLVGCACGECHWSDGKACRIQFHISQTKIVTGDIRQLRLFDSGMDPPMPFEDQIDENTYARRNAEITVEAQPMQFRFFDLFPHPG